ncbi:MAG: helix-turn-helix domain-containing protein [Porphyromonadaceae bacterium]|nr:helix-turn-helix domain-containing protein [Porphyromonadaceae bacterium]
MENILLTPNEAAKILKMSPNTIRDMCGNDPEFPCFKVGAHYKIGRTALEEWVNKKCKSH